MQASRYYFILLVLTSSLTACVTSQRTELFFGMNIPGGGQVSDEQWKNFTDSIVSPRFPEGYTEWDAAGKWLDTDTRHTISENTKVLTFIGKRNRQRNASIDSIVQYYIHQFRQQAVLRLDSRAKAKFISSRNQFNSGN